MPRQDEGLEVRRAAPGVGAHDPGRDRERRIVEGDRRAQHLGVAVRTAACNERSPMNRRNGRGKSRPYSLAATIRAVRVLVGVARARAGRSQLKSPVNRRTEERAAMLAAILAWCAVAIGSVPPSDPRAASPPRWCACAGGGDAGGVSTCSVGQPVSTHGGAPSRPLTTG